MKIKNLFLVALIGHSLFACSSKEDGPIGAESDVKSVSVVMAVGESVGKKATDPTDIFTKDTLNVNSVLITLTDASGVVIQSKTVTKSTTTNSDWDKLTTASKGLKFINIPQGVSKVYVYGNPGTAVSNNVVSTKLANQQGSGVLYYGVDEDLTPVQDEPINPDATSGKTYTANVTITPIVARFQVTKISFKNAGEFEFTRVINNVQRTADVTWTGFTGNVKGIYFNNFYNTYNNPGTLADLMNNTTFDQHISAGQWLFDSPATNATAYASYSDYVSNAYQNLPLETANKCYSFNFFPGTTIPKIHLDLSDLNITGLDSSDPEVFNPALAGAERFANIVKYYNGNVEMTAADFVPGTLYNMEIELIPMLDNDLANIQYNALVHVTIAPWAEQTLIPGFDLDQ